MVIGPVRRISTAEAVENHLLDLIHAREFGPGDPFPSERELQERMGVGRLAVREGLARLSALGIVRVDHGKGTRIRDGVDPKALGRVLVPLFPDRRTKSLNDLLRARSTIEGELSSLAALARTAGDLRILDTLLNQPGIPQLGDEALAELDLLFHEEVARIADNAYLTAMHDALTGPIREYLLWYVRIHKNRQEVIDRHRPILEAIRAQDPTAARRAAVSHLEACKSSIDGCVSGQGG